MRALTATPTRQIVTRVLLVLTTCGTVLAHRLPLRVYTVADGLARDSVRCIVEDSRGYLWLGTDEGLSRFDGEVFRNYGPREGLTGVSVRAVVENGDGTYWVGTSGGLFRFDPRRPAGDRLFERVDLPLRPPAAAAGSAREEMVVTVLHRDRAGRLWIGTGWGAAVLADRASGDGRPRPVAFLDEAARPLDVVVRGIADDGAGGVFLGTRWQGVFQSRAATDEASPRAERRIAPEAIGGDVRALLRARDGRLWAGSLAGLIELVPDGAARRLTRGVSYTRADGLPDTPVQGLAEARGGDLLAATDAGIAIVTGAAGRGARVRKIDRADGLPPGIHVAVTEDAEGNLWAGSAGAGLSRVAARGFAAYGAADGLVLARATGALLDRAGRPCFVTRTSPARVIVSCFDGTGFESADARLPPSITRPGWGTTRPVAVTRDGFWIATEQGLVLQRGDGTFASFRRGGATRVYATADGLAGHDVVGVFATRAGAVWASTSLEKAGASTLSVLDAGAERFRNVPLAAPLPASLVLDMAEDAAGALWFAFANGDLVRHRGGGFERIADRRGLELDAQALAIDAAGRLWIAGTGGLARVDDPSSGRPAVRTLRPQDGLSSIDVTCVAVDRAGIAIVATGRGIDRLDPGSGVVRPLGPGDGLPPGEARQCLADGAGRSWFAMDGAVLRLDSGEEPLPPRPRALIGGVRVAGFPWPVPDIGAERVHGVLARPGQGQLTVDLVGLGSRRGGALRFQYRLGGTTGAGGEAWSTPRQERSVALAGLAPGRYHFEARAVDALGRTSVSAAGVSIRVLAPFWRRGWFWTAAGTTVAAALFVGSRARARRKLDVERLRTRIAMDLHDELGSGLGGIGIMSALLAEEGLAQGEQRRLARSIADTSSELGFALTDIVWSLRPGNARLDHLAYFLAERGGRLFAGGGARFATAFPEPFPDVELSLAVQRAVQLVALEALHNAAKYAAATRVGLSIAPVAGGRWALEVDDDGGGIPDVAARIELEDDAGARGHGLRGMLRRARSIGADLAVGPGASGRGTRVRLVFEPAATERPA